MEKRIEKKIAIDFTEEEEKAIETVENIVARIGGIIEEEHRDTLLLQYFDVTLGYDAEDVEEVRQFLEYLNCSANEVI